MADYVSKYTGSEVDNILDEAIELPGLSDANYGDVLTYDEEEEGVVWRNPLWTVEQKLFESVDGFDPTLYLTMNSECNSLIWDDPLHADYVTNGQILMYTEDNGMHWDSILNPGINSRGTILMCTSDSGTVEWSDYLNVSNASSGSYLKYVSGSFEWVSDILDASSANEGDVLKIVNGIPTWTAP